MSDRHTYKSVDKLAQILGANMNSYQEFSYSAKYNIHAADNKSVRKGAV